MKTNPLLLLICILLAGTSLAIAQPQIEYFPTIKSRHQQINQFTDVFISSHFPFTGATVNRYFEFDPTLYTYGYYRQISLVDAATTIMVPG